ncbi:hypothetical protein QT893_15230, partial [Xanthomonas fragariae]|nr:hypothetical protein [Xanthomonas fragariae]
SCRSDRFFGASAESAPIRKDREQVLKDDCRLRRCRLKGAQGDALHVLGCAAGYNLRWLLRWIAFLRAWMRAMGWSSLSAVPLSPTALGA